MTRLVWTLPDGQHTARWAEDEGGGGGSLPDWWTVDSTPGSESVTFGGAVSVVADDPDLNALTVTGGGDADFSGNVLALANADGDNVANFGSDGGSAFTFRGEFASFTVRRLFTDPTSLFVVSADSTIGFFGNDTAAQQTLDPATATTVQIANALIASTLMAAA